MASRRSLSFAVATIVAVGLSVTVLAVKFGVPDQR